MTNKVDNQSAAGSGEFVAAVTMRLGEYQRPAELQADIAQVATELANATSPDQQLPLIIKLSDLGEKLEVSRRVTEQNAEAEERVKRAMGLLADALLEVGFSQDEVDTGIRGMAVALIGSGNAVITEGSDVKEAVQPTKDLSVKDERSTDNYREGEMPHDLGAVLEEEFDLSTPQGRIHLANAFDIGTKRCQPRDILFAFLEKHGSELLEWGAVRDTDVFGWKKLAPKSEEGEPPDQGWALMMRRAIKASLSTDGAASINDQRLGAISLIKQPEIRKALLSVRAGVVRINKQVDFQDILKTLDVRCDGYTSEFDRTTHTYVAFPGKQI